MKIRGMFVEILVELSPETYNKYFIYEKHKKVLYVRINKVLFGMITASDVYYKKSCN